MKTREPQKLDTSEEGSVFLYRPALWVLYFGLISFYLILRFAWIGRQWPTHENLQLEIGWAAIGTVLLIASSVTMGMAKRDSQKHAASRWMMLSLLMSLLLGFGFLIIQAREYRQRWSHNLLPSPFSNSLHDRADLYYLSAVHQRLMHIATEINASKVRQNQLAERFQDLTNESQGERARLEAELARMQAAESERSQRLILVNRLLQSESRWTAMVVATSEDEETQRMAIASMAYDIKPHRAFVSAHEKFRELESKQLSHTLASARKGLLDAEASAKKNSEPIRQLLDAVAEVKTERQNLESQLKSHIQKMLIEEENESTSQPPVDSIRSDFENQLSEVQKRFEDRNSKLTAAAKLVTDAEDNAAMLSQEINTILARQGIIDELDAGLGLNQQHKWLHLPVCIPAGNSWAWTYFTLTIVHTIHLAYTLLTVALLACKSSHVSGDRLSKSEHIVRNWHSMVIVWITLFVLIYLI